MTDRPQVPASTLGKALVVASTATMLLLLPHVQPRGQDFALLELLRTSRIELLGLWLDTATAWAMLTLTTALGWFLVWRGRG